MKPLSADTSPEVERMLIEGYRRMPPELKLKQAFELGRFVEDLVLADIQMRYPNASLRDCKLRLVSRTMAPRFLREVFGWDPETKGY